MTGDKREGQAEWGQVMAEDEDGAGVEGRAGEGMAEDGGGGKQCLAEGEPVPLHARCSTSPTMEGTRASRRPGCSSFPLGLFFISERPFPSSPELSCIFNLPILFLLYLELNEIFMKPSVSYSPDFLISDELSNCIASFNQFNIALPS